MGQPLPLPGKIPVPADDATRHELKTLGISIYDDSEMYSTYSLPEGWTMRDATDRRVDQPQWYIVDELEQIRVCINGSWKKTYSNKLYIEVCHAPYKMFKKPSGVPAPCETSVEALGAKLIDAISK